MPIEKLPGSLVHAVRSTSRVARNPRRADSDVTPATQDHRSRRTRRALARAGAAVGGIGSPDTSSIFALRRRLVTFIITRDARSTISVIIVAGACGIAAGTRWRFSEARVARANLGAIIKGGLYFGNFGPCGYRRSRQDRHAHVWAAPKFRLSFHAQASRKSDLSMRPRRQRCAPSIRWASDCQLCICEEAFHPASPSVSTMSPGEASPHRRGSRLSSAIAPPD